VQALAQVALAREDVDMSETILSIASPLLVSGSDEDAMDIDGGHAKKAGDL